MRKQVIQRIENIKNYIASGVWADPHSPSYTNGYDKALKAELAFLESLLKGQDETKRS